MVFLTPPYKDPKIKKSKEVLLQLQKRSDPDIASNVMALTMMPEYPENEIGENWKRKRQDLSGDLVVANRLRELSNKRQCCGESKFFANNFKNRSNNKFFLLIKM